METRACGKSLIVHALCALLSLTLFISTSDALTTAPVHKDCTMCHESSDRNAVKSKINETCLKCHEERKGKDHRVGMVSKVVPEGLPLASENTITCVTCHEPHGKDTKRSLLRMEFNQLCVRCHKDK